jgi:hypothetical protein
MITIDGDDWIVEQIRNFKDVPVEGVDYIILNSHDYSILATCQRDPEWLAARGASISRYYKTPVGRAACRLKQKEIANRPEVTAKVGAALSAHFATPEGKEQHANSTKASWADPVIRQRRIDGIRAALARKNVSKPTP